MKKFCRRFKNSIMGLFAACVYLGGYLALFGLLGIDNRQTRVISRTSIMMTITYVGVIYVLTRIYGGYEIGKRNRAQIRLSMMLSHFLTDLASYAIFVIMTTNDENGRQIVFLSPWAPIAAFLIQFILIVLFVYNGNRFFSWVVPPKKTLVILSEPSEKTNVLRVIKNSGELFDITRIVRYDDEEIKGHIKDADAVFFYDVPSPEKQTLTEYCYKHLKSVYANPSISDIVTRSSENRMFGDLPFFAKEFSGMTMEQRIAKRLMDIFIAAFFLIVTSPVMLISALLIKMDDGGPVFFRQERATIRGRVFSIYKFRTMKLNSENISVSADDSRITKAGKFLRKYRIDEIPQFLNVIKGEMSLVGPRPEMLENVSEYERELPEFRYRLRMKAGLTGLAQVTGRYNTSSRDKLVLDLMYIENFSISMDVSLLFQTVLVFFNADDSTEGFGARETEEAEDTKEDPLISIVTVSYNSEKTIRRTIESVLNQTYARIEYLIIDGASTDKTGEIAESYRKAFEEKGYIYRIYSEKDKGIYDAMNKGVLKATGEIVGIINSDDWYEVDAVENVVGRNRVEPFDLCFADLKMHMPSGDTFIKKARLRNYVTSRDWNHPTQFVKRTVYDKHLFRLKNMSDDMEFYFRVRRAGYRISVIHETLANFQMGGVSSKIKAGEIIPRIARRYEVYRVNGYSRFYIFECVAFELIKFVTSRF